MITHNKRLILVIGWTMLQTGLACAQGSEARVAALQADDALSLQAESSDGRCKLSLTPDEVGALVQRVAIEEGIDPKLAEAVARAESSRGMNLHSPKGAVGIMQLMPGTGKDYGVVDRCDPEQNVRGGIRFLRDLIERFDGNELLALAAYNAGPQRVYQHKGIPVWNETAKYVVTVLNYWKDFEKELSKKETANAQADAVLSVLEPAPLSSPQTASPQWIGDQVLDLTD